MANSLIVQNGVIEDVILIRKKSVLKWPTVIPFVVLYAIATFMYNFPEIVWGSTEYLVYQAYIDFFHAILVPFVAFVHGFASLYTVWSVRFRVRCLFEQLPISMISKATDVMVVVKRHKGTSQVIPLQTQTTVNHAGVVNKEVFFIFQQRIWVLSKGKEKQFIKPTFPNKLPYSDYHQNKGFETKSQMEAAKRIYGDNALPLDIPEFFSLLVDHMFAPFFVFQMFCVMLWCLDEYWMYSIFTGFMMVMMECTVVFQRIRNMKTLRQMGEVPIIDVVVMRCGKFEKIRSNELLPLDLMIVPNNTHCPADAVLISGSCVMNEAMLTGESTPQLKAAMEDNKNQCLMTKRDTCHMLFGGTMCLLASGNTNVKSHDIKEAAMAVVIKTGFETKQGKLLRTILNSQSRVSENSSEAFGFIGILLIFAIAASGYLLRRGLADPTKDRWKLFLHCVQIITSVVPTELPMQLSLAVNASLIALMRLRIFCTEPFRVPFAGKLDTCCFDKTGTITTDEMLFSGVDPLDEYGIRHKLETVPKTCETVLAGCHALVHLEAGEIAGDAMEKAAVETLGYRCLKEDTVVKYKKPVDKECGPVKGKKSSFNKTVSELPSNEVETTIHIIQRFPFNPVVRRMSCVITTGSDKLIVCKGSPEGIQALCVPDSIPENYTDTYEKYAAKGYRVIALASKQVPQEFRSKASLSSITRDEAEKDLIFAGFAIFTCPLKKDAEETIKSLIVGSHRCVVITGDNIQTALEVSRIVGIAPCKKHMIARQRPEDQLQESVNETLMFPTMLFDSADFTHTPHELSIKDVRANTYVPAPWHKMSLEKRTKELHEKFDLCVDASQMSSAVFAKVVESCTDLVSVWSRCNPSQKEDVISRLKALGHVVLMAGDGTNDVGGLKQAHVGIAVLNSHAHEISAKERKEQDAINAASKKNQITATAQGNIGTTYEDPEKLPPIPPGYTLAPMPPPLSPDASFMMRLKYEMAIATRKAQIKHFEKIATNKGKNTAAVAASPNPHGDIMAQAKSIASGDSDFGTLMESAFNDNFDDESNPMIKLGDASIAAPFTAKSKRLMAVVDIVRNGRSTLVTTLQMYKILALNSLVNAYSMSVLHSDGIKMGEKQMLVTGVVLSICFLSMARCQPSEHLSPQRPISRVFHPYMICSIFGQFSLHLYSLMSSVHMVKNIDADVVLEQSQGMEELDFKPSLLNTIVFLMQTVMTATTFAVNYRGQPFMQKITNNKPLFYSLIVLVGLMFYFALEVDIETNDYFEMVRMPSEEFKYNFVQLLVVDIIGSYLIEFFCLKTMTDG